jgi:1-deoxy-D-xylulose-5-phosphate synthase
MLLETIHSPKDLKKLSMNELEVLADEIRRFLIESISKTGGHLSSNLGAVELTLALHYVLDAPDDKIIFDVGHQSYVHKMITGRLKDFPTLRQFNGLSGFQKRAESEYDCWEAGHSSTSLSAGLGMAAARDILKKKYEVAAVIGDGSIGNGMALEALSDLGAQQRKMMIVFNDNNMSISSNHSGLEQSITRVRTSGLYRQTKKDLNSTLSHTAIGRNLLNFMKSSRDSLKHQLIDAPLFSQFNVDYIGPVDGHNIKELIHAFQTAKEHDGPVVIHVLTQKGQGYPYAMQDEDGSWHGVGPFDIKTGKAKKKAGGSKISWSDLISTQLTSMAAYDPALSVITPAMEKGSCLGRFAKIFPNRFFDVGIAEEHAITMAAGMAQAGLHPFVSIYSTFLQRGYDQLLHDVCRMDLPVVLGIDRAGLVGEDGDTHQGIYDIAFLRSIPNLIIAQPKDAREAWNLLHTAFAAGKPFALRYPRGQVDPNNLKEKAEIIPIGTWEKFDIGRPEQIVIAYGDDVDKIITRAQKENLQLSVVNARFFKPLDETMLKALKETGLPITVYETDNGSGGLSAAVLEYLAKLDGKADVVGLPDGFVQHGNTETLKKAMHISLDDLFERLEEHAN